MDTIRVFFSKIRALFLIFKKRQGRRPPPPPPLVARLLRTIGKDTVVWRRQLTEETWGILSDFYPVRGTWNQKFFLSVSNSSQNFLRPFTTKDFPTALYYVQHIFRIITCSTEAVARRCSIKKVILKIFQSSQEKPCLGVPF